MTTSDPFSLQPGTRVGFYEVVNLVGRGGFGALYKVLRDGEPFALKLSTFNSEDLSEEDRQGHEERVDREVVALKSLRHPNIVRVHAFERWPDMRRGFPYIVMDFVDGHRLYDWRNKHTPSLRRVADVFQKIALALNEMHRLEVFHRDLKSENVLIRNDGEPIILDFGISRPRSTYTVTRADTLVGTYTHFPPELCQHFGSEAWKRGERFTYRATADLHAVGYMFYRCITGKPPFKTDQANSLELLDEIATVVPPRPSAINPAIPAEFDVIVMRLLEKDPARRYQTGAELAAALTPIVSSADKLWDAPLGIQRSSLPKSPASDLKSVDVVPLSSQSPVENRPSVEIVISDTSPAATQNVPDRAPGTPFSPPTAHDRRFVSPDQPLTAATESSSPNAVPAVPSEILRAGAKIEAARAAAERSRWLKPVLIAGGVAIVFIVVFAFAFITRARSSSESGPRSLLSEAAQQDIATEQVVSPQPSPSSLNEPKPRGSDDARKIDRMLAERYGKPTGTVGNEATKDTNGPGWLMRGKVSGSGREAVKAEPARYGIPMGSKIRARLQSNLDSRIVGDGPVEAMLVRPFVRRGEVIFPSRTMLYGTANTNAGRFAIAFNRLRLPDDTEVPFDGLAMDSEDSKPGLPASRRIASSERKQDGLAALVVKDAASAVLNKAAIDDVSQVASNAGQTVISHQGTPHAGVATEALLLEKGGDFDVFVKAAF